MRQTNTWTWTTASLTFSFYSLFTQAFSQKEVSEFAWNVFQWTYCEVMTQMTVIHDGKQNQVDPEIVQWFSLNSLHNRCSPVQLHKYALTIKPITLTASNKYANAQHNYVTFNTGPCSPASGSLELAHQAQPDFLTSYSLPPDP
jgi:hypothetical protein